MEFYDCPHVHCQQQLVQCPRIEMIVHVSPLFTQRNGCPYVHIKTCLVHFKFPTITTITVYLIPPDITLGHLGTAGEQRASVGRG